MKAVLSLAVICTRSRPSPLLVGLRRLTAFGGRGFWRLRWLRPRWSRRLRRSNGLGGLGGFGHGFGGHYGGSYGGSYGGHVRTVQRTDGPTDGGILWAKSRLLTYSYTLTVLP
uniref:Uncharacterized protein n=1 Tax=Ixodes ricinus TaxID=34613 RepID=A0A090XDY8_IXORI